MIRLGTIAIAAALAGCNTTAGETSFGTMGPVRHDANAQPIATKWTGAAAIAVCPSANPDPTDCPAVAAGRVAIMSEDRDMLGRSFWYVRAGGRSGYITNAQFRTLLDQEPRRR